MIELEFETREVAKGFLNGIVEVLKRWVAIREAQHAATMESTAEALKHMKLQNELVAKNNELVTVQIQAAQAGLDKTSH